MITRNEIVQAEPTIAIGFSVTKTEALELYDYLVKLIDPDMPVELKSIRQALGYTTGKIRKG